MNEKRLLHTDLLNMPLSIEEVGIDCSKTINDDTSPAENPNLVSAIDGAAQEGIEVHVIIEGNMAEEGYTDVPSIEQLTVDTVNYCQWGGGIVVAVSNDPRAFDILTSGKANEPYVAGPEADDLVESFVEDLQNDGAPYQADAANAIVQIMEDIEAYDTPEPIAPRTPEPIIEVPSEPGPALLEPTLKVGGFGGAAALVGAGGANLLRRKRYNGQKNEIKKSVQEVRSASANSSYDADSALSALPEDDAALLRALAAELQDTQEALVGDEQNYSKELDEAKAFWRNPKQVKAIYKRSNLRDTVNRMQALTEDTSNEAERVLGLSADLDERIKDLRKYESSLEDSISNLQELGFDTSVFDAQITNITSTRQKMTALREQKYVERTDTEAVSLHNAIDTTTQKVDEVPGLHESLLARRQTVLGYPEAVNDAITEGVAITSELSEKFHPDASAATQAKTNEMESARDRLSEIAARFAVTHESKDIEVLYERRKLSEEAEELTGKAAGIRTSIDATKSTWNTAKENYSPRSQSETRAVQTLLDKIDEYGEDVERATITKAAQAKSSIDAIVTKGAADKPQYINLGEDLDAIQRAHQSINSQVELERNEMIDLRRIAEQAPSVFSSELQEAQHWVSRHRGDISSQTISSLERIRYTEGSPRTRSELRETKNELEDALDKINQQLESAKRQYKEAEEEREEERRRQKAAARRQRQAAAAAARRRSSSSSSSFGSGGGHSSGGFGGGGGHKSGGF